MPAGTRLGSLLFGLIFILTLLGQRAAAQGVGQQFVGQISDSAGAAVPDATVTIHNEASAVDTIVKSTGSGDYTAPYLKPGIYTITVAMAGFESSSKTHIELHVDQASKIDFVLSIGNVNQTISVSGDTSQIELSKADRGEIIDSERITEMPSNGRQVLDLFALSPGAIQSNNPTYIRQQDNVSQNLQANGVTLNAVAENIDGSTNDNAGNYMGYNPPLDSVGEFKVVLNAYDASYGRSAGAAVDISLKSGSNRYHGDLYEFARRQYLDANAWVYNYSQTGPNINHSRDQFGAELDGPISIPHLYNGKDKSFFLIQWEQSYENAPSTSPTINSIPNPQWLTGNFAGAQYYDSTTHSLMPLVIYDPLSPLTSVKDPADGKTKMVHSAFPGNVIPQNRLNATGVALAQYYNDIKPNYNPGPGFAPYQNNFYWLQVQTFTTRNGTIKLDQVIGNHDRATVRWGGYEAYNLTNPNGVPSTNAANQIASQVQPSELQWAVEEIHTFSPNVLLDNKAVLSTYKQGLNFGARGDFLGPLGFSQHLISNVSTTNMLPYVNASGYIPLSSTTNGRRNISHEIGYNPSLTWIRGKHAIRTGLDLRLLQYTTTAPGQNTQLNFTGTWTGQLGPGYSYAPGLTAGNAVASLLLGDMSSGSTGFQTYPFYSQHYYGIWAEDDWKVTPKLTLNLGVRWDLLGARTERHNQLNGAVDLTTVSPINSQITKPGALALPLVGGVTFAGVNGTPRAAYSMNLTNIQPRVGAAYAFSPRTSLRAGFGEFFVSDESVNGSNGFSSSTSYNNSLDNGVTPYGHLSDPFPTYVLPTGPSLGLATSVGGSLSFINPHLQIPSIWQYSVSLEQLLTRRDTLDISYSSARGHNLPSGYDLNHISESWYAQCDIERGGNRQLCDATSAPAKVTSPFYSVPAFAGTSYGLNSTVSSSIYTRPYPQFTSVTENNLPLVHSWYNSMQVVASHNASRDLSLHFALSWSKNMQAGNYVDTVNNVRGRSLMSNDVPIAISLSGVYYLPVGRGKAFLGHSNRLVDAAVGGWEVAPYYVYTQGNPWSPGSNFEIMAPLTVHQHDLPVDTNHKYKRLQAVSPCVGYTDSDTPGLIHQGPSYIANNCTSFAIVRQESNPSSSFASNYSVQRNIIYSGVREPANHQFDVALSKRFAWNERSNLQIRLDAFNVLNHPNWDYGGGGDSFSNDPTSDNWGTIQKGNQGPVNAARELQISGKFTF